MLGASLVPAAAIAMYAPGLVVGRALRLRGLTWLAVAPALTFAVAGVSGPLMQAAGVPYTVWTFLAATGLVTAAGWLVSRLTGPERRRESPAPDWRARLAVPAGIALAAGVGVLPVVRGMGWRIDAMSQSWDSPVHANLVAYLAARDVGDWSVFADLQAGSPPAFYPVALHLVEALVVDSTGATSAWVYNAFIVLTPAQAAVSAAAAAARLLPARPLGTVAAALAAVVPTSSLSYLLLTQPYSWGVVLVGGVLALWLMVCRHPSPPALAGLALAGAGTFAVQPSVAVGTAVLLAVSWVAAAAPLRQRLRLLPGVAVAAGVALALSLPAIRAGSGSLSSVAAFDNKLNWALRDVLAAPLVWGTSGEGPQWVVAVAVAVGLVAAARRPSTRWLVLAHLIFVGLYLVSHLADNAVGNLLTGVWYNDPARLRMLFGVTGALLVGVGATAVVDGARSAGRRHPAAARPAAAAAVALLLAAGVLGAASAFARNEGPVASKFGNGPALTYAQRDVLQRLPEWVGEGQVVLNDPWHGSVWMFAYSEVEPLVGHYGDPAAPVSDLVLRHFDELETDADVRRAVVDLRVCAVYVGTGSVVPKDWVWSGLDALDAMPSLRLAYADPQSRVYVLQGELAREARCGPQEEAVSGG